MFFYMYRKIGQRRCQNKIRFYLSWLINLPESPNTLLNFSPKAALSGFTHSKKSVNDNIEETSISN